VTSSVLFAKVNVPSVLNATIVQRVGVAEAEAEICAMIEMIVLVADEIPTTLHRAEDHVLLRRKFVSTIRIA